MADDTITQEAPVFQGPALSATSDVPVVEVVETPAVETAEQVAAPEAEASEPGAEAETQDITETGADDAGRDNDTGDEPGKAKAEIPPYAKREITKARNRQREAQAERDEARTARAAAEARLDLALKAQAESADKAKPAADTPRPNRETFDTPDAYETALITWAADNASRTTATDLEAKMAKQADDAKKAKEDADKRKIVTERITSWQDKRTAFIKDHPDFEDIAEADDLKISPSMTELLLEADNGPELAYALGKDRSLAEKISQLSPAKAALEMGRLAASVEASKRPKVSKAPPPARPIGSRANAGPKSADDMSMEEYAAMRTPQILAERMGPGARTRAN